jgi:hypothetical protein
MAAVTVTPVAVCPCPGAALQVAAGGSAVDGPGRPVIRSPAHHPRGSSRSESAAVTWKDDGADDP